MLHTDCCKEKKTEKSYRFSAWMNSRLRVLFFVPRYMSLKLENNNNIKVLSKKWTRGSNVSMSSMSDFLEIFSTDKLFFVSSIISTHSRPETIVPRVSMTSIWGEDTKNNNHLSLQMSSNDCKFRGRKRQVLNMDFPVRHMTIQEHEARHSTMCLHVCPFVWFKEREIPKPWADTSLSLRDHLHLLPDGQAVIVSSLFFLLPLIPSHRHE